MRKIVKAVWGAALATVGVCALAPVALAERADERELGRFVPALGFVLGVATDRVEGHMNTTDVLGPQIQNGTSETRLVDGSPLTERTLMAIPSFGASLELMTPGVKRLFGSPRAFGRVDVTYGFGPDYNIPVTGAPGEFEVSGRPEATTEGRVLGQGASQIARTAPLLLAAGGGLAFTFDADGRPLRVKPSVEYMRHEVEVTGLLRRAVQVTPNSLGLSGFREVTLSGSDTRVYHMVGPGIEVDFDAARTGQFVFAPYVALKSWIVLDDTKTVIEDSNEYDEAVRWTFLPNRWAFGGTVGVRVRWAPE